MELFNRLLRDIQAMSIPSPSVLMVTGLPAVERARQCNCGTSSKSAFWDRIVGNSAWLAALIGRTNAFPLGSPLVLLTSILEFMVYSAFL